MLISLLVYVALFEWSIGPVPWIYMPEILQEKAFGFAVFISILSSIIIGLVSPILFTSI